MPDNNISALEPSTQSDEILGTTHWGYGISPHEACNIANGLAKKRAKRIHTCVTTKAIPGTETCTSGGPKGWQAYAVSANHKGSC
ncbi:hypothetical protein RBA41_06070 [Massilia sp. CCM 9210]|uniref:hypothetical protein n=1 Tax=Massilia scottii TaxID=3057166 RepID=UPI002796D35A|nr:hypothetical protein [Massilia sp. CCM 9210]MDQ1812867.1 hypothetical protein [Massilia sp. CCM 9210]